MNHNILLLFVIQRYIKYRAPNPSITTGRLVSVNTKSFGYTPPKRRLMPISIDATKRNLCLYVLNIILVRLDTKSPINTIGPTRDVDTDTNTDIIMIMYMIISSLSTPRDLDKFSPRDITSSSLCKAYIDKEAANTINTHAGSIDVSILLKFVNITDCIVSNAFGSIIVYSTEHIDLNRIDSIVPSRRALNIL
jgi:hypothetical protein